MNKTKRTMKQIQERLDKLEIIYHQSNFRQGPIVGKLINELEWVLGKELTDFD